MTGQYSHAAIASWVYDEEGDKSHLECVEFREWKGGRAVNLKSQVEAYPGIIDVFRASSPQYTMKYDCASGQIHRDAYYFNGKAITSCMRNMTGLPYGWHRILWLFQFYVPFLRLFKKDSSFDDDAELIYPVCSTAVAHCFSKNFVDLIHLRSDNRSDPSDLSRSPILHYLFTLVP